MPNDFFQFKQFSVRQDRCAMKVTLDACVFGAWIPLPESARRVLDVGTGTGLLALMLAQRYSDIQIDTVEIDEDAAVQAAENVAASPFADRINVIHADARNLPLHGRYDAVVSNPPFFSASLQSGNEKRMAARHDNTLGMGELLRICGDALEADGLVAVLWPVAESEKWEQIAEMNAYCRRRALCIQSTSNTGCTRVASTYLHGRRNSGIEQSEVLHVADGAGAYTPRFVELLRPFYLKL